MVVILGLDEDDLEEIKDTLYQSAKKDSKHFAQIPNFPNISRDEAGAPKEYHKWFGRFSKYLSMNGLQKTIIADRILGFPSAKALNFELPDLADKPVEGESGYAEKMATYRASVDARNDATYEYMEEFKTFMRRYQKANFDQRAANVLIANATIKNKEASSEIANVPDNDIIGYMTYLKLKTWVENSKGRNLSVIKRNNVMKIPAMTTNQDLIDFIGTFKSTWATFVEQYDDRVTDDDPEPWTVSLPNDTVNNEILDHLPNSEAWMSYRMNLDLAILDKNPLVFLANLQKKLDIATRVGKETEFNASVHGTDGPSPGADCYMCKNDPKGVPSKGHKPSDDICPHHVAWKKKLDKKKKKKKKKKEDKAAAGQQQSTSAGGNATSGGAESGSVNIQKNSDLSTGFFANANEQRQMNMMAHVVSNAVTQSFANVIPRLMEPLQRQLNTIHANVHAMHHGHGAQLQGNYPPQHFQQQQPYGHPPMIANAAFPHQNQNLNHYGPPPHPQAPPHGSFQED